MNVPTTEAIWCLAWGDVTDDVLQRGLDYACNNGADCAAIQPGGRCFYPDAIINHANYAYDTYWKSHNRGLNACSFGGTGLIEIIGLDPSTPTCTFPPSS
ncbi:hypothetical protein PIB30_037305 [Stylosanthes scabra]|uniref:X8 domain-containing protein n=1 Tax=Stylosanthes scabra TaxID=79078 RepID=A0ABU6YG42_9FABA|nr:hypothetical protein [Stylosanthes scabra]